MPYTTTRKRPDRCCECHTNDQAVIAARRDDRGRMVLVSRLCVLCGKREKKQHGKRVTITPIPQNPVP